MNVIKCKTKADEGIGSRVPFFPLFLIRPVLLKLRRRKHARKILEKAVWGNWDKLNAYSKFQTMFSYFQVPGKQMQLRYIVRSWLWKGEDISLFQVFYVFFGLRFLLLIKNCSYIVAVTGHWGFVLDPL